MKTDLYTKIVLTIIAGLLALNALVPTSSRTVNAQNGYWMQQVVADYGRLKIKDGGYVTGTVVGFKAFL